MSLQHALPFLEDSSLDLKVIHLIRDPRAVINSRKNSVHWCNRDCRNYTKHCETLKKDLIISEKLKETMPHRYMMVRFEDLGKDPMKSVWNLVNFLGVPFTATIKTFVQNHTNGSLVTDDWNSVYRDSKKTMYYWKYQLTIGNIRTVEKLCRNPMKTLNYSFVDVSPLMNLRYK